MIVKIDLIDCYKLNMNVQNNGSPIKGRRISN